MGSWVSGLGSIGFRLTKVLASKLQGLRVWVLLKVKGFGAWDSSGRGVKA